MDSPNWRTRGPAQSARSRVDGSQFRQRFPGHLTGTEVAIAALWLLGILVAVFALLGAGARGLAFLAAQAPHSGTIIAALLSFAIVLALVAGYVTWKRDTAPGRRGKVHRYAAPLRVAALAAMSLYTVAALALILGVLQFDIVDAAPVLPGQLGVAIAEIDGPTGGALSAVLTRSLRKEIESSAALNGRVTVVAAPRIHTPEEAQNFAATHSVEIVAWGQEAAQGFVPSVSVFEPKDYQLWYGDVPAPNNAPLTGDGSLQLDATAPGTPGFVDYLIGLIYLRRGNYDKAVEELQSAVHAVVPGRAGSSGAAAEPAARTLAAFHLALGRAREALGDRSAAAEEYRLSLGQDPGSAAAHIGLGNLSYTQGECQAALDEYGQGVRLAPRLPLAWYSHGNGNYCLKRYDSAVRDYQTAIRLTPPGADEANVYYLVLGVTLCQSGQTTEGLAELGRAREGNLILSAESGTKDCLKLADMIASANRTAPAPPPAPASATEAPGSTPTLQEPTPTPWTVVLWPFVKSAPRSQAVTARPSPLPTRAGGRGTSATSKASRSPATAVPRVPPTATRYISPLPTPTVVEQPATWTPEPASPTAVTAATTPTPLPPTSTALPATSTPLPPTATKLPPTATATPVPTPTVLSPAAPTLTPAADTPTPSVRPTAAAPTATPRPPKPTKQPKP